MKLKNQKVMVCLSVLGIILFFTRLTLLNDKKELHPCKLFIANRDSSEVLFLNSSINKNKRGYQGCPSLGYSNGVLFLAFIAGEKGEEIGNYIPISMSYDMGQTWKQDAVIISPNVDSLRVFDPSFWNDKFGNLRLSWSKSKGMWDGGVGGTWGVKIKEIDGKIWVNDPIKLFNGVMNVKPISIGNNQDTLLFPVSGWNISQGYYNGLFYNKTKEEFNGAFLYSSNYLPNKELSVPKKLIKLPTTQPRVFDEHMVIDLGQSKWVCMFRTPKGICTSYSMDAGKTWGEETLFSGVGQTAESRCYFGRLKSGNILLVVNNSTIREKLTAYLSTDNAKTFNHKVVIDSRQGVSYPDVIQTEQGDICLVYDYLRYPLGQIIFTKFTENIILLGDSTKIQKKIISCVK